MNIIQNPEFNDKVFNFPYKEALVHQVIVAYLANARSGTVAQKTRAEVRGGGKKPWRQKGTGRARAGTTRGPIWRTGGRAFAAKPRNYSQKVNKKVYRQSILSLFSELRRRESIKIVDSFEMESISTKKALEAVGKLSLEGRVLIVDSDVEQNSWLSVRNIPDVYLIDVQEINPYYLSVTDNLVLTEKALKDIEEVFNNV